MPRLNAKYDNRKVYRPSGTRYAEGLCEWPLRTETPFPIVTSWTVAYAIDLALNAFTLEFGEPPPHMKLVIEVTCTKAAAYATVYEIGVPG